MPVEHRTNPGDHEIVAKRADKVVYERRLNLPEGASVEVEIDAPIAPPAAPPKIAETPASEAPPPRSSAMRALPFYIGGGVLAVGAVVSFVLASSAKDSVAENAPRNTR